ncbi:MAG: DNA polymerase Y family protein [Steroidobacteraceae bacterium]
MAAIGKTLDLFESASGAAQRQPQSSEQQSSRHLRSRPALEIAPPPRTSSQEATERAALWLAITFPRLSLEALLRQPQSVPVSPENESREISFPHLTREVQGGSRRGSQAERYSAACNELQMRKHPLALEPAAPSQRVSDSPLVIVDLSHNQQRVVACNAAAAEAGIVLGSGLNAAYALTSELQVLARDEPAEQRLLETLAQWAGCFTPKVTLEAPDALSLEIKGSLQLFGGLESLQSLIVDGLQAKGIQAVVSVAPTPSAALVLSRTGQSYVCLQRSQLPAVLSAISIATLRWPDEAVETLHSMGVQCIGDCLRLPREGFARRFGPQLLLQLDQLLGRAAQPQRVFIARERFCVRRDFELDIEGREPLLLHLEPLFHSLESFLRPRQSGVQSLELRLRHREQPVTRVVLRFVRPMADASHALAVLAERMERLELPAPVIAARLRSGPLWPLEMETISHRLLADSAQAAPQALTRLIERLRARLGTDAVYSLQCISDHRPELASRVHEPVVGGKRKKPFANQPARQPTNALARPFWLLPQPQPLNVQRSWPQFEGKLNLVQGPERIESGWWDGNDICRDYYIAATPKGLRVWIYRERRSKRWFLHGIYG